VGGGRGAHDRTLEVELELPTPYFLDITSHQTLFPVRRDVIEAFAARGEPDLWTRPESFVSNGPYVLDEWRFRYEITMKRNPFHHDHDRLRIHRVVWVEVQQYHASMNLYRAGDLDYLGDNLSPPPEYLPLLATKKDFLRFAYLSTYWYDLNVRRPPLDDPRVRRALNLAIDKQELVDEVTQGGQSPATHYVPDFAGLGYADAVKADRAAGTDPFVRPGYVYDPERARGLLGEAGFPVEEAGGAYRAAGLPPIEILYNTSEGHRAIAVAIQDMWKRNLGVSVTLRNEEWGVMQKNRRDGNFQIARSGWFADYNHPHTWLDTFLSYSPNNNTGWADGSFDALLRRAAATADPKESIRRYREAEVRAVEGMSKIPLYFYTKQTLVKPWVMGFVPNARNVQLVKWLWIDPERQEMGADAAPAYPSPEFPPPGRFAPEAP
jgi:oligopeptide transport system substrate-binding protein